MSHESFERPPETVRSSERSFGLVFAAVFAIFGLLPLLGGDPLRLWCLAVAAAFLVAALAAPRLLAPLNRAWQRLGELLHRLVSPVVLGIMFFLVVTPTGWLRRMLNRDPFKLQFDSAARSYWIERCPPGPAPESLKDQF